MPLQIAKTVATAAAILISGLPMQAYAKETKIHIWFTAFIPNTHPGNPGYIKTTSNGKTVIEAPENSLLGFIGAKGSCFRTDERGFNGDPKASARVTIEKIVVVNGRDISRLEDVPGRAPVRIGATENVDCRTGDLLATKTQGTDGVKISGISNGNFVSSFGIQAKASNPFYPSAITPKIDMDIVVERRFLKRDLHVYGALGVFPGFEAYYAIDGGPVKKLYALNPADGSSAWSLIDLGTGVNTRNFDASIPVP